MKILIITPVYPPPEGGIQTFCKNIVEGLENKNHNLDVLVAPKEGIRDTVAIPDLQLGLKGIKMLRKNKNVERLAKRAINSNEYDLVHIMHIKNYKGLEVAKKNKIPTSLSIHLKELENEKLAHRAIDLADKIHFNSNYTKSKTKDLVNEPIEEKVIYPGVKIDKYETKNKKLKHKDAKVFCICRHVERKNLETLIEAWKIIERESKISPILEIAGEGEMTDKLISKAKNLEKVRFLGRITEKEKVSHLQESDLFTLTPTRINKFDAEGFGIVYLEAQAAGTPIVSSKRGGVEEAVGDAGLYVEDEKDPNEIAKKVEQALDEKTWNQLRESAKERINDFSVEHMAAEFESWFQELSDLDE